MAGNPIAARLGDRPAVCAEHGPSAGDGIRAPITVSSRLAASFPDTSVGWYRKTFQLSRADLGKRISIEFDGVFRDALVMINGYASHRNESGYAPFRVDITDFANYDGANVF